MIRYRRRVHCIFGRTAEKSIYIPMRHELVWPNKLKRLSGPVNIDTDYTEHCANTMRLQVNSSLHSTLCHFTLVCALRDIHSQCWLHCVSRRARIVHFPSEPNTFFPQFFFHPHTDIGVCRLSLSSSYHKTILHLYFSELIEKINKTELNHPHLYGILICGIYTHTHTVTATQPAIYWKCNDEWW